MDQHDAIDLPVARVLLWCSRWFLRWSLGCSGWPLVLEQWLFEKACLLQQLLIPTAIITYNLYISEYYMSLSL